MLVCDSYLKYPSHRNRKWCDGVQVSRTNEVKELEWGPEGNDKEVVGVSWRAQGVGKWEEQMEGNKVKVKA